MTRNNFCYDLLRLVYVLFTDYLRIFMSTIRVVPTTWPIDTFTLRILTYCLRFGERYKTCKIEHFICSCYQEVIEVTSLHIYFTISTSVKSSALRKTPWKKRTHSPSPEPPPQLDPVDVEDTEQTELEVDIVASERDSTISRSDASDDGAATATATTTPAVSQDYRNK